MGKLKNLIINNEEAFNRIFKAKQQITDPRDSGLEPTDEDLARYEAEFADWLDMYEKSFGDEKGYLP